MLVHSADEMRPLQNGVTLASVGDSEMQECTGASKQDVPPQNQALRSAPPEIPPWLEALPGSVYLRDGEGGRKRGANEINICFKNSFSAWQREI